MSDSPHDVDTVTLPLETDFLVAGGGVPGICAALEAARLGFHPIVVEKEWVLGGNGGPLLGVPWGGCFTHNPGWHETGVVEELSERLYHARAHLPASGLRFTIDPTMDVVLTDLLAAEDVTVLRRHAALKPLLEDKRITSMQVMNLENLATFEIAVNGYVVDATGDATVAAAAGADTVMGRESREQTGERSAPDQPDNTVSASSITAMTVDLGVDCPFQAPEGTPHWNPDKPASTFHPERRVNILFQVDAGGDSPTRHPLHSPQAVWLQLRRYLLGMWDYLKNEKFPDAARTHQLVWVSPLLGRRESRRILGDYLLTQTDAESGRQFPDAAGICGHGLDYHPPSPDGGYECIFYSVPLPFEIPFRCLYSRNIANLFAAGRNISCSHIAFSGTRIIRTGGQLGQAAAIGARLCRDHGWTLRELADNHSDTLQQTLTQRDIWLPGRTGNDTANLVHAAPVHCSSAATIGRPEPSANGRWQSAADTLGAALYTYPETLNAAKFYVRNASDREVTCEFLAGYGETPIPQWPDIRERKPEEPYVFGPPKRAESIVQYEILDRQAVTCPARYKGWLEVRLNADLPGYKRQHWRQALLLAITGDVEVFCTPPRLEIVDAASPDDNAWTTSHSAVPVFQIAPEPLPGNPEHLLDGHIHREGLARTHAWISEPDEELPQWVELRFPKPITCRFMQLCFDVTERFSEAYYLITGAPTARNCVTAYRIEAEVDGEWQPLIHETGNYRRFRQHELAKPVQTGRLRLTVDSVHDPTRPARVYDWRLYDQLPLASEGSDA